MALLRGRDKVGGSLFPPPPVTGTSLLEPRRVELAPAARASGFDRIRVIPLRQGGTGLLGSVELTGGEG